MDEKSWVRSFVSRLNEELSRYSSASPRMIVVDGKKLHYASEIQSYGADGKPHSTWASYETDLLVSDISDSGHSVPRVVVECKLGSITTHDALTYSSKAATHKHVHPYLRYGILAGNREHYAIPGRLVRHGAYFDFMMTWTGHEATPDEWQDFCELLLDEVNASRLMQELLTTTRQSSRKKYHILHRPLRLRE